MHSSFIASNYSICVVDGDARCRNEVITLLQRVGYHATGFERAEELLDTRAYDGQVGVISEIVLPGMSGLDLIGALRERGIIVPVLILTTYADVSTAVVAMRASVADYLVKPYAERDLVQRLQAALIRHGTPLN